MPIIDGTNGVECKTNTYNDDHTEDHWQKLSYNDVQAILRLNPDSDRPDRNKDQIIYIQRRSRGIMIVDSDKIRHKGGGSMHELAWMEKNPGKGLREIKGIRHCPVAGLGYTGGELRNASTTFNYLSVWII